jgi:hypothetical protein
MTAHPAIRSAAVQLLIRKLSLDRKPILCGPWRSEVGFEALYWRPFLAHLALRVPDFWQRAVIVTRGGAANLYGWHTTITKTTADGQTGDTVCWEQPKSVDLYTLRTVAQIRQQNLKDASQTGLQKQTRITPYDRQLLRDAADVAKVTRYHVLHPSWMYWALAPFWDEERGLRYLFDLTDFAPLAKPLPPVHIDDLPAQYVAVKFYGRATWPHPHPVTSEFVAQVIETIAKQVPVLVLNTGHDGDEHTEMGIAGPNIFTLPTLAPEVNLGVQLALLGRAQAFIGTYGGVAQAALRMGVPSASFWVQFGGTAHAHLSLSSWLSKRGNVPFVTGGVGDAGMWRQLFIAPEQVGQPLVAA